MSIELRRRGGKVSYIARLRIQRGRRRVVAESRSFGSEAEARAWAAARAREIEDAGVLEDDPEAVDAAEVTLGRAIDRYLAHKQDASRPKGYILRRIQRAPLASMRCGDITAESIVSYAETRLREGVTPQTVNRYLAELSAVFQVGRLLWRLPLPAQVIGDAWKLCSRLGLSSKSRRRDRRPSLAELDRLMRHFAAIEDASAAALPMTRLVAFAVFSTRRRGEICRMRWQDLTDTGGKILIRDMKNPGQKIGNNVHCDLPARARAILIVQPRTHDRIWPYHPDAVTLAFSRGCEACKVKDLHFHDLRHEGISWLFEIGYGVPEAQKVTGHATWASLQRYTHIADAGDRYAGWRWFERVNAARPRGRAARRRRPAARRPAGRRCRTAAGGGGK